MRLLVSVRAESEVPSALAGGADIVDAKEPARGSLGAVSPEILSAIAARVPRSVPLSVALGDPGSPARAREAIAVTAPGRRTGPVYLKLGFAGSGSVGRVTAILAAALDAAAARSSQPVVVPVAYADHSGAATVSCEQVLQSALALGARALLIDTYLKEGGGLLDRIEPDRLRRLAGLARERGLLLALAGSLDLAAIDRIAGIADVIGVRGSACSGGRSGAVDARLVRGLRDRLTMAAPALAKREAPMTERRVPRPQVYVGERAEGGAEGA